MTTTINASNSGSGGLVQTADASSILALQTAGTTAVTIDTSPGEWIQTSYNTKGGVHINGGTPLRKNYAGIGYTYDSARDAFIPPQPFPSWTLVEETCQWTAPIAMPTDGNLYLWNEASLSWIKQEQ